MTDKISPEEKLLRLIRSQKRVPLKNPLPYSIPNPKLFLSLNINKIISVIFILSCIYLIYAFIYPLLGLREVKLPQIASEKNLELKTEPRAEVKPYEYYSEGAKNRQIFGRLTQEQGADASLSSSNLDLLKDINLMGIISGDNPQAVIEDKKTQKSYYLSKGQFFGEFQVEDIQDGKIILNYKGERIELYL